MATQGTSGVPRGLYKNIPEWWRSPGMSAGGSQTRLPVETSLRGAGFGARPNAAEG